MGWFGVASYWHRLYPVPQRFRWFRVFRDPDGSLTVWIVNRWEIILSPK